MKGVRYVKVDGASVRIKESDTAPRVYHVARMGHHLGKAIKLDTHIEVHPSRGASVNAPNLSEAARILFRMFDAGWIE